VAVKGITYAQVLLLALIQGAAELLPISSSAHVTLAQKLMHLDPSAPDMTFLLVMLHTGTMFAVLFYFWPRWKALLLPAPAGPPRFHFLKMIVLATVATGVLGLGLLFLIENVVLTRLLGHEKGEVESLFKSLPLIGTALAAVGVLILVSGLREAGAAGGPLTTRSALWIGLTQGLCLPFRGFSRSGATISAGLLCGVSRPLSEDFSFALAVVLTPPVIGRYLWRLLKAEEWHGGTHLFELLLPGLVGMVLSFLAGLVALRVLSVALERGRWRYFGYYCLAAGAAVLAAAWAGY
jgi:undecaprenyl-diphosphatase